jgi:hypothetical protein
MSAKYQQHPMEDKFHADQTEYRKAQAAVDAAYAAMIEQTSMEDTRDNRLAFGVGYAQGKYDANQERA